ncbi:unnamed protein product [Enterobius vermicularis]|uniref:MARVEL domain-containing protein n=1 Tax=Enterobius vermicularis TaxID=51028 RepID=A0A0N4V7J3_ENTVE|nr:unnamed protein product [Enterobius vermicularis]
MKYYVPSGLVSTTAASPNITEDPWREEKYFKNATFGPRLFCWLDPETPFHCEKVTYFSSDEPGDVTASVEQSVKKAFIFMVFGTCLDLCGVASIIVCCYREHPYRSLLCSALLHIFAGISTFLCIIVYMSSVSKEVGNKQYPASEIDEPLFHYSYGYSFLLLKKSEEIFCKKADFPECERNDFQASFLGIEIAALLSVLVYMAKRDEITYNRYRIRHVHFYQFALRQLGGVSIRTSGTYNWSVLSNINENVDTSLLTTMLNSRYYQHSRFRSLERPSW